MGEKRHPNFDAYAEEIRRNGPEARQDEVTAILKDVRERHLVAAEESPFFGINLVTLDLDRVFLPLWGKTLKMPDGMGLLMDTGYKENGEFNADHAGILYTIGLAEDEEQRILDAIDRGETEVIETDEGELHLVLNTIMIEPADKHIGASGPLKLQDVFGSIAINEAIEAGDMDRVDRLYVLFYTPEDALFGKDRREEPPKLEAIRPTRHYVPNAKSTLALTNPAILTTGLDIDVGKKRGQITIGMRLWPDEDADASISVSEPLDHEDVRIIASVVTLKQAGNRTISPYQLCEDMGIEPTPANQEETHRRVMRLRKLDGHIDWTEQARRYGITNPDTGEPFERAEITGHLIDANVFDGTDAKGNRCIRYTLLSDPITYQHAHQVNQVLDYSPRLRRLKPITVDGKRRGRVTDDQARLIDTILRYVHIMKNPNNHMGLTIGYDTIFKDTGINTSTRDRRRTAVRFVNDYLRALQDEGTICGFVVNETGRSHRPESVSIVVEEPRRGRKRDTV